jgi:hypothetical protein
MAIPAPRIEIPTTKSRVVVAARPRRAKCFIERPDSPKTPCRSSGLPIPWDIDGSWTRSDHPDG